MQPPVLPQPEAWDAPRRKKDFPGRPHSAAGERGGLRKESELRLPEAQEKTARGPSWAAFRNKKLPQKKVGSDVAAEAFAFVQRLCKQDKRLMRSRAGQQRFVWQVWLRCYMLFAFRNLGMVNL